jgi:acetamidase/formamidase
VRHTVPEDQVHYLWDEGNEPTLRITSGDEVVARTREVSDGQVTPESTADALASLDMARLYPLVGPIYVEGAEPGDTLAVEMLSTSPASSRRSRTWRRSPSSRSSARWACAPRAPRNRR